MESTVESIWSKSKVLVKGLIIGLMVLLLLIPTFYVSSLIDERQQRQNEAIAEVSSKWAGRQVITGPVIVIPYWQTENTTPEKRVRVKRFSYFLPDNLNITSSLNPQEKYRGIYKVMLYNSKINLAGSFNQIDPLKLGIPAEDLILNEAYVKLNISDVKGLNEELKMNIGDSAFALSPQPAEDDLSSSGLTANLPVASIEQLNNLQFNASLDLNGSEQLLFTPVGRSTTVSLNSPWPHPSFSGDILPNNSQVSDTGFNASWKSFAHKRAFPQQWKGNNYSISNIITGTAMTRYVEVAPARNDLSASSFGANLYVPVNNYQKTTRSIKYAVLCILLTFAAFFLIETTSNRSVHPLQYGLIGLALILFYTLLLSFSEYISFNLSYAIAAVCTIGLITWFVKGILSSARLSAILSSVLVLLYIYIFTILQLQDYSLLFGSIGLFIALAVIMYFSRKLKW
jgi:inner membrane protein